MIEQNYTGYLLAKKYQNRIAAGETPVFITEKKSEKLDELSENQLEPKKAQVNISWKQFKKSTYLKS